jgi:hypothetical protein
LAGDIDFFGQVSLRHIMPGSFNFDDIFHNLFSLYYSVFVAHDVVSAYSDYHAGNDEIISGY